MKPDEKTVPWAIRNCKKSPCDFRGPHANFYDEHGNHVFGLIRCKAQALRVLREEISKRMLPEHEMESLRVQIEGLNLPQQGFEERRRESRVSRAESMTVSPQPVPTMALFSRKKFFIA